MIDRTAQDQAALGQKPTSSASTYNPTTDIPAGYVFPGQNVSKGSYTPTAQEMATAQNAPAVPPAPIPPVNQSPVPTTQPSPKTATATPYTGSSVVDALSQNGQPSSFADRASLAAKSGIANYTGSAVQNTQLLKDYQTGFSKAQASGQPAPQTSSEGRTGVNDHTPQAQTTYDPTQTEATLADNKAHQQYLDDYAKSQSSTAQTESLTQTYTDLSNSLGIPALNTELMNMKNLIDGTEQDIRDEVTKAGGFATNSQVMALTDARNKTLLQNYNNLLQTRDNATQNLTTMMNLTEQDRAYAQQKISDQLNFDRENIAYADKAVTNAQDVYKTMQQTEGWDGIYKAAIASGDPQALQKINTTMGPGFDITSMAKQDALTRANDLTKTNLQIAQENASLKNSNLDIAKKQADLNDASGLPNPAKANQPGYSSTGIKFNTQNASDQILNQFKSTGVITKDNVVPPSSYNQAKAWWVQQGLNATEFDNIFGQYKNDQTNKQYN